jgi:hypothetical protein
LVDADEADLGVVGLLDCLGGGEASLQSAKPGMLTAGVK